MKLDWSVVNKSIPPTNHSHLLLTSQARMSADLHGCNFALSKRPYLRFGSQMAKKGTSYKDAESMSTPIVG